MIEPMDLQPGQVVRWNLYIGGHLSTATPLRVVEHTPDGLLLWLATGSPVWRVDLPGGVHLRDLPPHDRPAGGHPVKTDRWSLGDALIYQPTGASHAVFWFYAADLGFRGWYVNLERRTRRGEDIDVEDLELDVTVAPDRSWQWKDERSFAEKTGHPAYWSAEEAHAIRAEGRHVAGLAEAGAFPFDGTWCDFVPPASWAVPPLPPEPVSTLLAPAWR